MRLYYAILERVTAGDIVIGHIPDAEMPADFLTKIVSKAKEEASIEYLTNQRAWAARAPLT